MSNKKSTKVYLDRIEGDIAVLYLGEDEEFKLNLPLSFLPSKSKEGDSFSMTFAKVKNEDVGNEIDELRKALLDNN